MTHTKGWLNFFSQTQSCSRLQQANFPRSNAVARFAAVVRHCGSLSLSNLQVAAPIRFRSTSNNQPQRAGRGMILGATLMLASTQCHSTSPRLRKKEIYSLLHFIILIYFMLFKIYIQIYDICMPQVNHTGAGTQTWDGPPRSAR